VPPACHIRRTSLDASARRKALAVGPVKSAASSAILTLPPFAIQALRPHRRSQARLRLAYAHSATVGGCAGVEPGRPPRPVELDLVFHTERGTPVNPLRHADGGALAQRIYIHQLPQTAPRLAELIQGVFGPAARDSRAVSAARLGGNPDPQGAPNWAAQRRGRCVTELKQWPDVYRL
jgi:hypothetical protein